MKGTTISGSSLGLTHFQASNSARSVTMLTSALEPLNRIANHFCRFP